MDLKATNLTEANLSNVKIDALRDFYKKLSGEEKVNAQWSKAKLAQEIELLKAEEKLMMLKAKQAGSQEEEVIEEDEEEISPPTLFDSALAALEAIGNENFACACPSFY